MIKLLFTYVCFLLLLTGCKSTGSNKENYQSLPIEISPNNLLEHYQVLSSNAFQGRKVATQGNLKAQQYIISQLKQFSVLPFKEKFTHSFDINSMFSTETGNNVIGIIKSSEKSVGYIVLTAHFDHLGIKGNKIYNGADDNASGSAALLSIAEQLAKQPINHDVIVLFTDAEENGLKGSKAFLKQNQHLMSEIKLNINMDMLAGSKNSKNLHFISRGIDKLIVKHKRQQFNQNHLYHELAINKGFKRGRLSLDTRINWIKASDHGVFHQHGIPFIYYGVGTHKNYHSQHDEFENTNHRLFIHATNAIYQQLLFLDQEI